ncbi:hypothetical protein POTOM_036327 [Populus tomentosa]|uniref:Uncharacterized protein n=1 Tax=Populus tomentosa TaxID=118781 RepID=A0A8X8CMX1_POPTO|nr:hypothetical protein POTOM_036327 [Populus tomentosa]
MHAWLSRKHFSPNGFSGSLVMFMDIQLTLAFMNFAGANYMIQKITVVSVDPIIQIGVVNISEVRFKASMAMSRSQMLRGVLGFWSPLMTALGSTENMPENKGVEDLGDVIREGGGALAKGLFRGVAGIQTNPPEEAKNSGFAQGVGKGITGAAAQPVSWASLCSYRR